ncbi:MAG: 2Fe-2S iron-sulfur cluster binding domain-containing protein [Oscillospiraceae bacterium]|nr:2Fe-2S iron-sulfur cluster binding domain-containing protein [Oscillospiraceae bacterium]
MRLTRVKLIVNGVERPVLCDLQKDTLATAIRRLGLTGTKVGCGIGVCGACSVILNGESFIRPLGYFKRNHSFLYRKSSFGPLSVLRRNFNGSKLGTRLSSDTTGLPYTIAFSADFIFNYLLFIYIHN